MINIVYTSAPNDGLFYYSYEHFIFLKSKGYKCDFVIFPLKEFKEQDYIDSIKLKYKVFKKPLFNISQSGINIMMGRSLLIFAKRLKHPNLNKIMKNPLVLIYNNNHPLKEQNICLNYFKPEIVYNLCDKEVYPNGIGNNFIKTINFDIYIPPKEDIQYTYLFNGTNEKYYKTISKIKNKYISKGILVYNFKEPGDVEVPVSNLMGKFKTYVYTKETFDPAPRIIQECKYFNKELIYLRKNLNIPDGGSVYYQRYINNFDFNLKNNHTLSNLYKILDKYD